MVLETDGQAGGGSGWPDEDFPRSPSDAADLFHSAAGAGYIAGDPILDCEAEEDGLRDGSSTEHARVDGEECSPELGELPTPTSDDDAVSPGYSKRVRGRSGPDARVGAGRDIGAVENAIRNAPAAGQGKNIFEPTVGTVFDSLAEAYEFYNLYSWEVGFGIRYGNSNTNRQSYRTSQDLVCQRQGTPQNSQSQCSRCGCNALLRMHRTDDHGSTGKTASKNKGVAAARPEGLSQQTLFCRKCRKPGHNSATCHGKEGPQDTEQGPGKKARRKNRCSRCKGLGHNAATCAVDLEGAPDYD